MRTKLGIFNKFPNDSYSVASKHPLSSTRWKEILYFIKENVILKYLNSAIQMQKLYMKQSNRYTNTQIYISVHRNLLYEQQFSESPFYHFPWLMDFRITGIASLLTLDVHISFVPLLSVYTFNSCFPLSMFTLCIFVSSLSIKAQCPAL